MKKSAPKKVYKTSNSSWIPVGVTVMILLFVLAYAIHKNQKDEIENRSKTERIINKVQEIREIKNNVKNDIKKLVK